MHFYRQTIDKTLAELKSTAKGLTAAEASSRLKKYGDNAIKVGSVPLWKKILEPFMDIFTLVLASAALISYWQGEALDGTIILVIIGISAVIFYIQRFSTDRVLRNLNKQSASSTNTIRAGRNTLINTSNLVPGDIVVLSEGEKVPADMRIIKSSNLRVDESVLTGESLPVEKNTAKLTGVKEIYEQNNMLFSGSFVVGGSARGVVTATGNNTQFGNIATLAERTESKSPVQLKIDTLITKIVIVVGALALVTFGLALFRGLDMAESLRFVIALSVSAVPEGLPVAISVVLVLGMRRIATKKAVVQQMRAIETLGIINTIATDKTGTLTENRLSVQSTWQLQKSSNINLALSRVYNRGTNLSDPLDKSLLEYSRKTKTYSDASAPVGELPFDQSLAMSATVWHDGSSFVAYIKGSPESIMLHSKLSTSDQKKADQELANLAQKGYRVIGIAKASLASATTSYGTLLAGNVEFIGFVAVADTLRTEAAEAIKTALSAGVTVRMITGDHAETAYQIGKQLKMVSSRDQVFDCRNLDQHTDEELTKIVQKTKVFARVIPEQKYRLLTILKQNNITAMTGDGVNDVPALTNAHIGIAMGSGSSIAKDAGDIILLDDNFKTIIDAMQEGRAIIANIKRMLFYLLSTNAGEILTMIGALLVGTKLPLEAVQILWVNLVTDTSMVIPLGLEPAEKNIMKQKPLKPNEPILGRKMIVRTIISAVTIAALTLATYLVFLDAGGHAYAQTMAFAALIVSQWGNAFSARSDNESVFSRLKVMNRSFYAGLLISIGLQGLVFFGPLGSVLHIASVDWQHLLIVSILGFIAPIIVCEFHKLFTRSRTS